MKLVDNLSHLKITKASNGYLAQCVTRYGTDGDPEFFPTFIDLVIGMATAYGETATVSTLRESERLSESLKAFISVAIAPQLLAIEAKVNPGIENIVETEKEELF